MCGQISLLSLLPFALGLLLRPHRRLLLPNWNRRRPAPTTATTNLRTARRRRSTRSPSRPTRRRRLLLMQFRRIVWRRRRLYWRRRPSTGRRHHQRWRRRSRTLLPKVMGRTTTLKMRTLRTLRTNFLGGLYFSRLFRALVFCGSLVRKRAPGVSCSCPVNTGAPVASSTRYLDAMGTSRLHGRHRGYLG